MELLPNKGNRTAGPVRRGQRRLGTRKYRLRHTTTMQHDQLDQRLDSLLIAVGRLQGRTDEHSRSLASIHQDILVLDRRVKELADTVIANRIRVAVLDWKLILVAVTSGSAGGVLLRLLGV